MNKQIIIINGSGGVGKDTFVEYCKEYSSVLNISSVDKVKEAARILGWTGSKSDEDRKFLSDIKILATQYDDSPYKYIKESIKTFKKYKYLDLMFIHLREPVEIERVKQDFGCLTMLIVNRNVPNINSNMADANVDKYNYDFLIDNSYRLYDLRQKAKSFVMELFGDK
jgi:dephospho-CoA kinase